MDLASWVMNNCEFDTDPIIKYGGVGVELDIQKDYLVVLQHPVTTEYSESRIQIEETLFAINDLGVPTFWFLAEC